MTFISALIDKHILDVISQKILDKKQKNKTLIVGISGAQGSGKTTLTTCLKDYLKTQKLLKVVQFSLDDFYFSHHERISFFKTKHKLLITRGVPGTHNIEKLIETIDQLVNAKTNEITQISRFNKAIDDLFPISEWNTFKGKPDVILLEGWCVGAQPQTEEELKNPINELEKNEDSDRNFRIYVNDQLKNNYLEVFNLLDFLIFLKVPSFEKVLEWRWQQEQELAENSTINSSSKIMNRQELMRFISFYERITKNMLKIMPSQADLTIDIDENHKMIVL